MEFISKLYFIVTKRRRGVGSICEPGKLKLHPQFMQWQVRPLSFFKISHVLRQKKPKKIQSNAILFDS